MKTTWSWQKKTITDKQLHTLIKHYRLSTNKVCVICILVPSFEIKSLENNCLVKSCWLDRTLPPSPPLPSPPSPPLTSPHLLRSPPTPHLPSPPLASLLSPPLTSPRIPHLTSPHLLSPPLLSPPLPSPPPLGLLFWVNTFWSIVLWKVLAKAFLDL